MARLKNVLPIAWMMLLFTVVFYELTYEPESPVIDKTPEKSVDKAQLIQYLEIEDDIEVVHEVGLDKIEHHTGLYTKEMPHQLAEEVFYVMSTEKQIICSDSIHLGNDLTGWDVCVAGSFRPIEGGLIYSLGITKDWSFEEAAESHCKCEIKVFDPSLGLNDHEYKPNIHFYNTGIGRENTVDWKYWKMRTLGTILKQLKDDDKYIEYLKIDIQYGDIDVLRNLIKENILQRVKQLGIEFHVDNINKIKKDILIGYGTFIQELLENNWRRWYSQAKQDDLYQSKRTGRYWPDKIRNVFINTAYMFTNKKKKVELSPVKVEGRIPDS